MAESYQRSLEVIDTRCTRGVWRHQMGMWSYRRKPA